MIKKIRASEFYKHVLTILTGSTLAQLIPLASEPILVRLFTPEEFGILQLFLSVATIFAAIATARYEMAIVLPKKDEMAINILVLSLFITVLMSLFSGFIVIIFGQHIATWAESPELLPFLKWVPLFVFFSGVFQSFNQWATRKKYFHNIAASKFSQSGTNATVSISTGLANLNTLGLIYGQLSGWFAGSLPLIFKFYKRDKHLVSHVNKKIMLEQAREHSDFPKINSAHVLSDIGQQSLVNFIISNLFTAKILGFYSRMIRIVKVPAGFIGSAVGQVFFQKASEQWQEKKDIRSLFLNNLKLMSAIGFPIFALLAFFGPAIFGFVLGEEWSIAGRYAQLLTPWLFLNFIISPFTHIPLIVQKQQKFFLLSLSMNILVILAFIASYYINGEIETALILVSSIQVIFHIYLGFWFYKISRNN